MKKAFDFSYHSVDGDEKQLSAKVQEADKTVLYFSRYMGCPFCQVDMMELCEEYPRLREKNVQLLQSLTKASSPLPSVNRDRTYASQTVCATGQSMLRLKNRLQKWI